MKNKLFKTLLLVVLMSIFLVACNADGNTSKPNLRRNIAARVNEDTGEETPLTPDQQAAVDAAIAATATAMASTPTATGTPETIVVVITQQVTPTPTPTAATTTVVNYYDLSEEELAALIEDSVAAALEASQYATELTYQATYDGSVSYDETITVQVEVEGAEELIAEVENMMAAYHEVYGQYATEALSTLNGIEEELSSISSSLATISDIMVQGAETAQQSLEQLNAACQKASQNITEAKEQSKDWASDVRSELDQLQQWALSLKPSEIAKDRSQVIENAYSYLDTLRSALADNKVSLDELQRIAQLGANASAGLKSQGTPQFSDLSDGITNLTSQTARGELPQARNNLDGFEKTMPERESSRPEPSRPERQRSGIR